MDRRDMYPTSSGYLAHPGAPPSCKQALYKKSESIVMRIDFAIAVFLLILSFSKHELVY